MYIQLPAVHNTLHNMVIKICLVSYILLLYLASYKLLNKLKYYTLYRCLMIDFQSEIAVMFRSL